MSETGARVAKELEQAIKAEFDGHNFYLMAARSTQDPKGREIFEQLATEELGHLRFLDAQKRSYQSTGRADPKAVLGTPMDLSGESPIFSPQLKERIQDAHFEMSALSIGIQLEHNSEKHYREQSEKATDPEIKSFFARLAEWEAGHYHALLRQQEELKEDFWSEGGFAPW